MKSARPWIFTVVVLAILAAIGLLVGWRFLEIREERASAGGRDGGASAPAPVEIVPIERGAIQDRRVFSGTLEAVAMVTIAPKIAGRILSLPVDLSDTVSRGQVVAVLDSDEYQQAVAQSEAELAVANAELIEAQSAATIAARELERVKTLHERGVASDSQLDTVTAEQYSRSAAVEVAKAQVTRAEAALRAARIRLGYTTIRAEWEGGDEQRIVSERMAEEGDTVAANTPLLSIIELDPIDAAIFSTEREYALLERGQTVTVTTDAYPDRAWEGTVSRVSPVFREGSRQARVEVRVANADDALKPGMFVRVEATLRREQGATIVPVEALAQRDGQTVVFLVDPAKRVARMAPVRVGIRSGGRVQIFGDGLEGHVVTLGQQLLEDATPVTLPSQDAPSGAPAEGGPVER
jgi:RND family efflux transporter MFP subunit